MAAPLIVIPPIETTDDYDQLAKTYKGFRQISTDNANGCIALLNTIGNPKGKTVLDIGCGQGNFTEIISSMGADVVGVDISNGMIDEAMARPQRTAHYEVISRANFPFPNAKFDWAISTFCMCTEPDFDDVEDSITEAGRVLKPGGLIGIMHVNFKDMAKTGEKFDTFTVEKVPNVRHGDLVHVDLMLPDGNPLRVKDYYHDDQHYSAALKRQGFQNININNMPAPDGRALYKVIVAQKVA